MDELCILTCNTPEYFEACTTRGICSFLGRTVSVWLNEISFRADRCDKYSYKRGMVIGVIYSDKEKSPIRDETMKDLNNIMLHSFVIFYMFS